ncbi:MAG: isopeptide-forming domain-containing fimbrial protein [Oscillospiraceae bacterium]|nr:isopeptide-forming domain-containing fimbrial protein [Oscillospiraceae bacterium]
MRKAKQTGKQLLSLLLTLLILASLMPLGSSVVSASSQIPDAPTREQASVIKFIDAKTNYLGGIALDAAGKVWTWGYNSHGMLGLPGVTSSYYAGGMRRVPYFVDNNINIVRIEGGYHTNYALDDNGVLYAWGKGNEGQMGNNTVTAVNLLPTVVTSLNGIKITKMWTTTEASSATYALADDGKIYAWGYSAGSRIPTASAAYQRTAVHQPGFDGIDVVDMSLGYTHGILLDSSGDVYSWGSNTYGQLGHGNTTTRANPTKVEFFNNMTVTSISAEFNSSMASTSDGRAFKWGTNYEASPTSSTSSYLRSAGGPLYYNPTGRSRSITTPEQIVFDLSSSDGLYSFTPAVARVTAGRYASYVTDIYGRVWYYGWNVNYGFATDGPLFTTTNGGKHSVYKTNATLLKTLGDGDTQGYMNNVIGPVFSGPTSTSDFLAQYNSYNRFGQWSQMGDGLHPTIYDKKYMETTDSGNATSHTYDYPLDAQGRRLVYVIRRVNGVYSGNFYVASASYTGAWCHNITSANLPAGVTEETSVPVVKEDERSWIGLVVDVDNFDYTGTQLNELPYIANISTYQSAVLFIDNVGNLYKQSLDGSGSIAWGWDYSKYERGTAGNDATRGLYNFYNYEITFMRGAPTVPGTDINFTRPTSKIYLVEDANGNTPTDTVNVTVTVPGSVTSAQLNLTVDPELTDLRYLFIPYDSSDPNFNLATYDEAQFNAAYNSGLYQTGNILGGQTYKDGTFNFSVDIANNGKLWVLGKDIAYTRIQTYTAIYTADNFYTPIEMLHRGQEFENPPAREVYAPTDDNVTKTSIDPAVVKPDGSYVGIPLDLGGSVIANPTFGYDSVNVSRYNPLPGALSIIWGWHSPQEAEVDYVLDNLSFFVYDAGVQVPYVHTFYYDSLYLPPLIVTDFEKNADPGTFRDNGDEIVYTVSFTMPDDIGGYESARITDILPASGLAYQNIATLKIGSGAATPVTMLTDTNGNLYIDITGADFAGSADLVIELALTFRVAGWTGGEITNTAELRFKPYGSPFPDDPDAEDEETIYPPLDVDDFIKTANPGTFRQNGDEIVYTVSFTMPTDLRGYNAARISDILPATGLAYQGIASLKIGGNAAQSVTMLPDGNGNLYYDITGAAFTGAAGQVIELALTFQINGWVSGDITNTAELRFKPADGVFPDDPDEEDEETITPPLIVDDFTKTANPGTFKQNGDVIVYTVSFTMPADLRGYNGVRITDILPASGLAYQDIASLKIGNAAADSITMQPDGNGNLYYDITGAAFTGSAGLKIELALTFIIDGWVSGSITNTAELRFRPTGGNFPDDPEAEDEETIYPPLDVDDFLKTANPGTFTQNGDQIIYTVSFKMPTDLSGYNAARISDILPATGLAYMNFASLRIGANAATPVDMHPDGSGNLYYDITGADFIGAAGLDIELALTFQIAGWVSGEITNTAELRFKPADGNFPDNPDADDDETIYPPMDVDDFTKTANPGTFKQNGDQITYTVSFTMPADLSGYNAARISDILPATGLAYMNTASLIIGTNAAIPAEMQPDGNGNLYYDIVGAAFTGSAGLEIKLALTFQVSGWVSGDITNTAELRFRPTGGNFPVDPNAEDDETIKPPLLVDDFEKKANPGTFKQNGDVIIYTVSFTMPNDLSGYNGARISDILPATGLAYQGIASLTIGTGNAETVTMLTDNDGNLYYDIIGANFTAAAGLEIKLALTFQISGWVSGSITNTAELRFRPAGGEFPDDPDVDDDVTIYPPLDVTDFEKSANPGTFTANGDEIVYTVRFTMPTDLSGYNAARIADILPISGLQYQDVATLKIGSAAAAPITMQKDNDDNLYYDITGAAFTGSASYVIELALTFKVAGWVSGDITNTAELYFKPADGDFPDDPDATDDETIYPMDVDDFIKDAALKTYAPGGTIDYTISWTLPDSVGGFSQLSIVDNYDETKVCYSYGSMELYVGSNELYLGTDFNISDDDVTGTLTTVFTAAGLAKLSPNALVKLAVTFNVNDDATGLIVNNAELFYNGTKVGEDDEEVDEDDFEKTVKQARYLPGDILEYEISVTLPVGIENRKIIEIIDTYPAAMLTNATVVSLKIGNTTLTAGQYAVTPGVGTYTVTINVDSPGHYDFRGDAEEELLLVLSFQVAATATGSILNNATISYDSKLGGGDGEKIDENDFSKDAALKSYTPGGKIDYTVSWTLPDNVSNITAIRVEDNYDVTKVSFSGNVKLSINGTELQEGTDFTVSDNAGVLTTAFTTVGIGKLIPEALIALEVEFNVLATASGTIINNAKMFYNNGTTPDGEDDEEVYEDDFEKTALQSRYVPGDIIDYQISITLPQGIDKRTTIEIVDNYPATLLTVPTIVSLHIGTTSLTASQYDVSYGAGTLTVTIDVDEAGHYDFRGDADKKLILVLSFQVSATATGAIINEAGISYDSEIGGGGITIVDEDDFSKDAFIGTYTPGGKIDYSVSFTLPEVVSTINALSIVDSYDATKVAFNDIVNLTIGGNTLVKDVDYTVSNVSGTLTISLTAAGLAKLSSQAAVKLDVEFNVLATATGTIINNAKLFYNNHTDPDGEDDEEVTEIDFSKDADAPKYAPGKKVGYTISWTLPDDVSNITDIKVVDDYDKSQVTWTGEITLSIDGNDLVKDTDFTVNDDLATGTLTTTLTAAGIAKLTGGAVIAIEVNFNISENAETNIINNAKLFYNNGTTPDGEDDEEVELGIGPITEADEYAGNEKTALLWYNPIIGNAVAFLVKVDDFDWIRFNVSDLPLDDKEHPPLGRYYLLWEYLPDGTPLENDVEYTFQIRAIDADEYVGPIRVLKSTPKPLGDPGGINTDLTFIYDVEVRPPNGYPNAAGRSADSPIKVNLEMPQNFAAIVIHEYYVFVGEDAQKQMYSDPGFSNPISIIDRMHENGLGWHNSITFYVHVISGNFNYERYYEVTVYIPGQMPGGGGGGGGGGFFGPSNPIGSYGFLSNTIQNEPLSAGVTLQRLGGLGNGSSIDLMPLSFDINNPTDRVIRMVFSEEEYFVDTRPGIAKTIKYLYTDPSFDDEFLIGVGDCLTDTYIEVLFESNNASVYPVQVNSNTGEVHLWAKYVEKYPYNPTISYYHIILIPPPSGVMVYMESLAGESTHPPQAGEGTMDNPFKATIVLPLSKSSIENPNMMGVGGDITMTDEGRCFLFANDAYMIPVSIVPLSIGENTIYTAVSSPSSSVVLYYEITVMRGYPFEMGSTLRLDYTINWVLPGNASGMSGMRLEFEYDAQKVAFTGKESMAFGSAVLTPVVDYIIENDTVAGLLKVSLTQSGADKMTDSTPVELQLEFIVHPDALGNFINNARLYYDQDLYGEGTEELIILRP